jgi:hypothetical protein
MRLFYSILNTFIILLASNSIIWAQTTFIKVNEFYSKQARQGVAVDSTCIYVIGSQKIAKYDKNSFQFLKKWEGKEGGTIIHLDSGVIFEGKLYCAHSNYPEFPMTSSVEIWDPVTLEHIGSHSFGVMWGSLTWFDYYDGFWYGAFAHYNKWKHMTGKGSEWTVIVKFDSDWQPLNSYVFPPSVVEKFGMMSNSGGSFGPDGILYCTGHDLPELYAMKFPESGSVMELLEVVPVDNAGQGIAWDRFNHGFIYCLRKKDRHVVICKMNQP